MKIGVNFFGPKVKLHQNFDGTLARLKEDGFTSAEICVVFGANEMMPEEMKSQIPEEVLEQMSGGIWPVDQAPEKLKKVRAAGLDVISCHMMLGFAITPEQVEEMIPQAVAFGKENQIAYYVLSLMKGLEEMKLFAAPVDKLAKQLSEAGIQLLYHNHEVECASEEGTTALEYLLEACPELKMEPDVGWLKFAGVDSVEFIKKYSDRIVLLHFKDVRADASPETRQTCFTAIGEGSIPLKEILQAARECNIIDNGLIIDQDDSPTDILDDLKVGITNMEAAMQG